MTRAADSLPVPNLRPPPVDRWRHYVNQVRPGNPVPETMPRGTMPRAMTVCIAGIWGRPGSAAIVTVADLMVSDQVSSTDLADLKMVIFPGERWLCMYSGAPVDFQLLTPHMTKRLARVPAQHLSDVIEAFQSGCKYLRVKMGRRQIETQLLIAGFDPDGTPHIFTSWTDGNVEMYDTARFSVVGIGSQMANASLLLGPESWRYQSDINTFAYRLLTAKFASERTLGVGPETTLRVLYSNGLTTGSILFTNKIREAWEASLMQPIPESATDEIDFILMPKNPFQKRPWD